MRTFEKQDKWIRIGWERMHEGRYKRACRAFRKANRPFWAEAEISIGSAHEHMGQIAEAESAYRRAYEAGSREAAAALAELLANTQRRSAAYSVLREAAAQDNPFAFLTRGNLYSADGQAEEARSDYLRAAELGLTEGWNMLALLEFNEGHIEEALACCREAHRLGNPNAAYNMALVLLDQDKIAEAREWLEKSAESGFADAMYLLGSIDESDGMLREAHNWYRKAAERGHWKARYAMQDVYADKWDRRIKPILQEYAWDKKAAEQLAILYTNRKQYRNAERIWHAIIDSGYPDGHYSLAALLEQQGKIDEALEHYRLAAAEGSVRAEYNLGVHYERRADNPQLAKYWYGRAVAAGHHYAAYNLGNLYYREKNLEAARELYEKAAARGLDRAHNNLANLLIDEAEAQFKKRLRQEGRSETIELFDADGQPDESELENIREAALRYRTAAEQEVPEAQLNLAELLRHLGEFEQSEHWYRRAAEQGNAEARHDYAELLRSLGREEEALPLYRTSAKQGFAKSIEYLKRRETKKT